MTLIIKKNEDQIDPMVFNHPTTPDKGRIVGLTGNIACGKSTVANILSEMGLSVLNADRVSFELTQRDGDGYLQIVEFFGPQVLDSHYNLDRRKLRDIIFNNLEKKKKLESILHPVIIQRMKELALECFHRGEKVVIFEAPLLIEAGINKDLDGILLITCNHQTQLERILTRDFTITKELAQKIMSSQLSQDEKQKYATWVIENNGTVEELKKKLKNWLQSINQTPLKNHQNDV